MKMMIEYWTLLGDELGQVAGKRGPTRLGFGLLLKCYSRHDRFPRGRGELSDEAVATSRARSASRRRSSRSTSGTGARSSSAPD
jgi:hypothetical protein